MNPSEAFRLLLGDWTLAREVSGQATMTGTAKVQLTGKETADYCERVAVQTATGAAFGGSQTYLVERTAAGFALRFANTGRLFQELRFAMDPVVGLRARAVHLCGQDTYDSEYTFKADGSFATRHVVCGPRKNYISRAQYRR